MAGLLDFQNISVNSYVIQDFYTTRSFGSAGLFLIALTQSLPLQSVHKVSLEKKIVSIVLKLINVTRHIAV